MGEDGETDKRMGRGVEACERGRSLVRCEGKNSAYYKGGDSCKIHIKGKIQRWGAVGRIKGYPPMQS